MITIICASNNKEVLNNCLVKSLENQTYQDYELIIVDTNKKKFKGAVSAINYGIGKASSDYVMIVHHDVIFEKQDELQKIVTQIEKIKDLGIVGVAGMTKTKGEFVGNITNGENKEKISKVELNEPTKVETIDEVLFILNKKNLEKYPLNDKNETWHLYAVEYCLEMHKNNKNVMVIPSELYHLSAGASMNSEYYKQLRKICAKYKNNYKTINTTCGYWYTNRLLLELKIFRHKRLYKK